MDTVWDRAFARSLALCTLFCAVAIPCLALAQPSERVDYYRSPYRYAGQIDPLGVILGRIGARYEWRLDPLLSRYLEMVYQPDIRRRGGDPITAFTLGIGQRIYLRDNAAMEGLFAGASGGLGSVGGTNLGFRISLEIGYKLKLGTSQFFIEPELVIDNYVLRKKDAKPMLPYIAVPMGYEW